MSKNSVTPEQLAIACRNYFELREAGMTENLAIRNVVEFADFYGRLRCHGRMGPVKVRHCGQWSLKAVEAHAADPSRPTGQYLRIEHGTPRRQFARMVLNGYKEGRLSEEWMNDLCDRMWRIAVITHEEDRSLARSVDMGDPEARWKAAGIKFRPKA